MSKDLELFPTTNSEGVPIRYTLGAFLVGMVRTGFVFGGIALLFALVAKATVATHRAGVSFDVITAWSAAQTLMERAGLIALGGAMAALIVSAAYCAVLLVRRWVRLWASESVIGRRRVMSEAKTAAGVMLVPMAMYGSWTSLAVLRGLSQDAGPGEIVTAILAQGWFTGSCGLIALAAGFLVPLAIVGLFILIIGSIFFQAGQRRG
jgi:hypothetical protein